MKYIKIPTTIKIKKTERKIDDLDMRLTLLKQELFLEEIYMDKEKFDIKSKEIKSVENQIETLYEDIEDLAS